MGDDSRHHKRQEGMNDNDGAGEFQFRDDDGSNYEDLGQENEIRVSQANQQGEDDKD